jgi:hypothetical protein
MLEDSTELIGYRDLFDDEAFVRKSSHDLLDLKDYNDYTKHAQQLAKVPIDAQDRSRVGFEALVRGRLPVVDQFLDQITHAFTAVQQKVLASLVISICVDNEQPQNVLEMYSFTFSYGKTNTGQKTVENVILEGTTKTITFGGVKTSLCDALKQLSEDIKDKPRLPSKRYIHSRLLYNGDWDGQTRIPGFRTDTSGHGFAYAAGWERANNSWIFDAGHQGYAFLIDDGSCALTCLAALRWGCLV